MTETRRVLFDGAAVSVIRDGDRLVAGDGRSVGVDEAVHLPPAEPTKIVAVHLNYRSRVTEFGTRLPPAPTYFHKPTTALNSHRGAVVRPERCKWLNYEGEVAIVIGRTCRNVSPKDAGDYIAGYTLANGEVRQEGSTDEMEWDMHYLVADIARTITLLPGDVLLSGTPANSRTA